MNIYQHSNQAGRWDGEAHHAAEDHGAAQHAQFVCHGHNVLHESAIQVGRGLDPGPRGLVFSLCQGHACVMYSMYVEGEVARRGFSFIRMRLHFRLQYLIFALRHRWWRQRKINNSLTTLRLFASQS